MKIVNVGLIGFGKIGRGVVRLLMERSDPIFRKKGFEVKLKRIADIDIVTPRGIDVPREMLTTDVPQVTDANDIDVVIELIGGLEPARSFVLRSLGNGKCVVTANKAIISTYGNELFEAALKNNVELLFEASVGGGIPIIRSLRHGLIADRINSIYGIVNGTTNYILTRMSDDGLGFEESLRMAQEKGYAEPDPTLDITGKDAVHKLIILLRIGFGAVFPVDEVFCEGISRITQRDIQYAAELGYTIKLLAIAKKHGQKIEARVHPAMIPSGTLLANIKDEFNAIEVVGEWVGPQLFYGKGAGETPTATAVVADIYEVAERRLKSVPSQASEMLPRGDDLLLIPMEEIVIPYYFRFHVLDKPGVLAQISRILADENISISSVIQKERAAESVVPLVIMTHEAPEKAMRSAIAKIDALGVVKDKTTVIRVEEI